jgi:hypothetical protein
MAIECLHPIDTIDCGNHSIQTITRRNEIVGHERMYDGSRIGQTRRFYHDALEFSLSFSRKTPANFSECAREVAAYRTANTTAVHLRHDYFIALSNQQMVKADLAKLVNDDQGIAESGLTDQTIEQGSLAAA